MTTKIIIARHGNTFGPGDTPTRVGARTDLPLVESGVKQAKHLGTYLRHNDLVPDVVYAASLKRSYDTAQHALTSLGITREIKKESLFNEIDYGPDENKTEQEVIARIGSEAINAWNAEAIVPPGWKVQPDEIIRSWEQFATTCTRLHHGQCILVVTSNGIARFSPHLTGDFVSFAQSNKIKLSTGAFSLFSLAENGAWEIEMWNVRPQKWVEALEPTAA